MLDDLGNELENTDTKIDTAMKKMAKVLHMNNGKSRSLSSALLLIDSNCN